MYLLRQDADIILFVCESKQSIQLSITVESQFLQISIEFLLFERHRHGTINKATKSFQKFVQLF